MGGVAVLLGLLLYIVLRLDHPFGTQLLWKAIYQRLCFLCGST
jgi:hypothetical protein